MEMCDVCYIYAGGSKTGPCRINWAGSEADKQLVHQPAEAPLEALGGHAIRRDGHSASRPLLHGQHHVQSLPHGLLIYTPLITPRPSRDANLLQPCNVCHVLISLQNCLPFSLLGKNFKDFLKPYKCTCFVFDKSGLATLIP